ncbi:MAG: class I SAM-dependent methyltransferase [Candidatus Rokuibacteriota bacterium]
MNDRKRTSCRACGGGQLTPFLSLGPTPLANAFLRSPDEFASEASYPLDVYFCQTCSLVQLLDVIDQEVLFREYIYLTGTSATMAEHHAEYAATVVARLQLGPDDLVVEIASNDGSLLTHFRNQGVRTLGIEPALNIARVARERGIDTIAEFFGPSTAETVVAAYGPARTVLANNVLAHVDDPVAFLRACKRLLHEDGLVVIEVPYLHDLIERLEYDTIYHEHLCYLSVAALLRLCEAAGLSVVRLERVPVHGGSLRLHVGPRDRHESHTRDVQTLAANERDDGLTTLARCERFAADVGRNRQSLVELLRSLRAQGMRIAGYGAPAKGNTLLNYCRIDTRLIEYTVDKNPMKVGRYTPGMHLPVEPASALVERRPDYVLLLAWNLAEEIITQQSAYRARGGRFIIPIPVPRVIEP